MLFYWYYLKKNDVNDGNWVRIIFFMLFFFKFMCQLPAMVNDVDSTCLDGVELNVHYSEFTSTQ